MKGKCAILFLENVYIKIALQGQNYANWSVNYAIKVQQYRNIIAVNSIFELKKIETDYKKGNLLCVEGRVYHFRTDYIPAYIARGNCLRVSENH